MKFEKIDITKENINPFQRIGQDWMLISAEREGKVNTMTASWGMMGVFWGKNVVTVGIRPQRFTKEFVDAGEFFTLTFFDGERKEEMGYLGKVSGRDEDKISKVGFHVVKTDEEQPTFEEGKMVFVCKKLMETQKNLLIQKWMEDGIHRRIIIICIQRRLSLPTVLNNNEKKRIYNNLRAMKNFGSKRRKNCLHLKLEVSICIMEDITGHFGTRHIFWL